jgi:ATP-dependent Lon protease
MADLDLFKGQKPAEERETAAEEIDPFLTYRVNLLVDNSDLQGAPVIMEITPTYLNLFGTIEYAYGRFGFGQTDFTKIKAGSFLKANGGYLGVKCPRCSLTEFRRLASLKRTLRYQTFEIQNPVFPFLISTSRLKPEPI